MSRALAPRQRGEGARSAGEGPRHLRWRAPSSAFGTFSPAGEKAFDFYFQ